MTLTTRTLASLVLCLSSFAGKAATLDIPISLRSPLPPGKKVIDAKCILTLIDSGTTQRKATSAPVQVPGLAQFAGISNGAWMIEVVAPGYWHQPEVVQVSGKQTVKFNLWPAATLSGHIKVGKGEVAPSEYSIRFQSSPSVPADDRVRPIEVKCPVKDGAWSCEVPAGLLDLRLHATHYINEYRWSLRVVAGETKDLGTLSLRRGSSVLGFTKPAPGIKQADAPTIVTLQPLSFDADRTSRQGARTLSAEANDRGFFSLEGVPPGDYTIVAQRKNLISPPHPVRVLLDSQVELTDPLVMHPPRSVDLHVSPEIDPSGKPWHIRLFSEPQLGGRVDLVADDSFSREGAWHHTGLRASQYTVQLRSSNGATWLTQPIVLPDDSNAVNLDIPLIDVRGTLKLGSSPLAATLYFGGESGGTSVQLESNDKGEFRGVLPKHDGPWNEVSVIGKSPNVKRTLRDVRVELENEGTTGRLDLVLPSTYVTGDVVDSAGKRVSRAMVNVQSDTREPLLQVLVEKDGTFEIHGLPPGTVVFQAAGYMAESKPVELKIVEDEPSEIHLALGSNALLVGRVLSTIGPVAGAQVGAVPTDTQPLVVAPVTTNANGEFSCPLSPGTSEVDLSVQAPGFAYKMFHLKVTDGPIEIPVDQAGGTLIVDSPDFDGVDLATLPYLIHNGARRALPYIGRPAFEKIDHGYRIKVSMLERGQYQVCIGASQRCASGFLPPLGELTLAIPEVQR